MKQHIALARKYRPNKLSELIGQDVFVRTFSNAIKLNRIHHAYLFTGTRGIGKTTSARIIALSLNCKSGETENPCLECEICQSILSGNNPDVIEIDAASNTGVDNIREIIENCHFQPIISKYKIYIIDEVHMLSKSAFNALLKTLEEPPEKVKFIFATTESRKIPITILSRCQKYFLGNISKEKIANHIIKISQLENYQIESDAAKIIAKHADGSMRDALSLLDQAISISENNQITFNSISKMLSIIDKIIISSLFYNLYLGNTKESLEILDKILSSECDPKILVASLLEILNDAMQFISEINIDSIDLEYREIFQKLQKVDLLNMPRILRIWQVISNSLSEIGNVVIKNYFSTLIFKICYISSLPTPIEAIKLISDSDLQLALRNFSNLKIVE